MIVDISINLLNNLSQIKIPLRKYNKISSALTKMSISQQNIKI